MSDAVIDHGIRREPRPAPADPCHMEVITGTAAQEMTHQSQMPVVRHYVENLLAAFALALSLQDSDSCRRLLQGVRLGYQHTNWDLTPQELMKLIGEVPALITISNVNVLRSGKSATYHSLYQIWAPSLGRTCVSAGTLTGLLQAGPQVWRWTEHLVVPFSTAKPELSTGRSLRFAE